MNEQEILKILKESFDNHISVYAFESIMGLETGIKGKDEFFKEIQEKLKLWKENS